MAVATGLAAERRIWPIFFFRRLGLREHFEFSSWLRARACGAGADLGTLQPLRAEPPMAELPVHAASSPSQPAHVPKVGAPVPARLTPQDVEAIARRVAELVRSRGDVGWATADELARRLAVRPGWIYRHAGELGGIKLGSAPNAPWRFDVEQALRRFTTPTARLESARLRPLRLSVDGRNEKRPASTNCPGTIGPVTVARATIRHGSLDRPGGSAAVGSA